MYLHRNAEAMDMINTFLLRTRDGSSGLGDAFQLGCRRTQMQIRMQIACWQLSKECGRWWFRVVEVIL